MRAGAVLRGTRRADRGPTLHLSLKHTPAHQRQTWSLESFICSSPKVPHDPFPLPVTIIHLFDWHVVTESLLWLLARLLPSKIWLTLSHCSSQMCTITMYQLKEKNLLTDIRKRERETITLTSPILSNMVSVRQAASACVSKAPPEFLLVQITPSPTF